MLYDLLKGVFVRVSCLQWDLFVIKYNFLCEKGLPCLSHNNPMFSPFSSLWDVGAQQGFCFPSTDSLENA